MGGIKTDTTPGMNPQSGLWSYAISALIQRSSGDKLLSSDLYQDFRLKAKNFRSRDGPSRGEFFSQDEKWSHRTMLPETHPGLSVVKQHKRWPNQEDSTVHLVEQERNNSF
ncbi:hypothetical protein TNCV_1871281 [Trichonephila clavipes]|nr:hypothetical protein TNCV_1871281 [Trichonephila clavipes]